jgi:hypothetical protein
MRTSGTARILTAPCQLHRPARRIGLVAPAGRQGGEQGHGPYGGEGTQALQSSSAAQALTEVGKMPSVRRVALPLLAFLLVTAGGAAEAGNRALPRATEDRPDEVRGPQVHGVYAIPSDGEDRALDTTGAIAASVDSFQRWLARETGGANLRLDTLGGELDVTFIRLPISDGDMKARGAFVRDEIERLMRAAGQIKPGKLYAVYYDGGSTWSCGGGAWPPRLQGQVGAMYLKGEPPGSTPCWTNSLAGPGAEPGYFDIGMLHELVHTLGFVAECAPHHTRNGHASDSANDLMWSGDAPWQLPPRLDIGRDDYYGHGRVGCADLARSEFLTSNPPPPPVLAVRSFVAETRARPGRIYRARLDVTYDGATPTSATVRCTARLRGRPLRTLSSSFAAGGALCRWRLPARSRGAVFAGTVSVTVEGQTKARGFRRTVR